MTLRVAHKFGRYFVTGGIAAMVDTVVFAALQHVGLALLAAASVSFLIAAVVNFQLSTRFVFAHAGGLRAFVGFLLAASIGYVVNVGVTVGVASSFEQMPLIAKIIGIATAFLMNFAFNLLIVFRDRPD
jgi:putative flippase GtrA